MESHQETVNFNPQDLWGLFLAFIFLYNIFMTENIPPAPTEKNMDELDLDRASNEGMTETEWIDADLLAILIEDLRNGLTPG